MDNKLTSFDLSSELKSLGCLTSNRASQSLNGKWQFRMKGAVNWLNATVPGCNFTDLLANNKISDPFYRCEETNLQWIEKEDWEYQLTFDIDSSLMMQPTIELVFEGLDTYCDVYLNGQVIQSCRNMCSGHRINCKDKGLAVNNHLLVKCKSPSNEG